MKRPCLLDQKTLGSSISVLVQIPDWRCQRKHALLLWFFAGVTIETWHRNCASKAVHYWVMDALGRFAKHSRTLSCTRLSPSKTLTLLRAQQPPACIHNSIVFSVFIGHVMKNKNRNRSIHEFKNLGYDRWLQYEQPLLESGLCCFSFARYSQQCVTQLYRALYGEAMFVPFGGT